MSARLEDLLEQQRDITALRAICIDSLRQLATSEHHFRVFSILFLRTESDTGLAAQDQLSGKAVEQLTDYFSAEPVRHDLAEGVTPKLAAMSIHTYFAGIYFEWLKAPQRWNLAEQTPALVDVILRGLLRPGVNFRDRA
ncbi:hypothetical protein MLC59_10050 [Marinobacter bryozoorum]|nr:hypothetical protein [Marinobacter bryozoorum]